MCASMSHSTSDVPCRKPMEKSETRWFILSRLLFYLLCVCSAFFHESYSGTSCGLPFFSLLSLSSPPHLLTLLFQLYLTNFRFGVIFLSKQYSGLSTLSLMTFFIILLTVFHYASAVLLKLIRRIITFLCLSSKLA